MAIRIERNEQGNCINFHGSSNPTYWNACLSGEVDTVDNNTVNVVNDVITAATGVKEYEFFQIPYTDFVDADGNGFADAQATADYITANANVIGVSGGGIDLIGVDLCFKLDDTSTSVMIDNGYSYGVNTIKAVAEGGHISIKSQLADITHFYNIESSRVCINSAAATGGLNDVVNELNELFTVGAFESVVISDPFSTMVADVAGVSAGYTLEGSTVVDPVGDALATNSSSGNLAGVLSTATINQAGEYFTFDIRGESQIGFGLVHTQDSFDNGYYSGSSTYANPSTFAVSNSAHYGFQFSHWFHPTPNGSWTNYGANTSYSQGEAWYNSNVHFEARDEWLAGTPIKIKVGLTAEGYIEVASLADDGITWKRHARTSYPAADGAEFKLGVKFANASGSLWSAPKVHLLEEAAPTMYFRYIESPDGVFNYPIFATAEEAEYYDTVNGGTGTYTTAIFPDDPTGTQWKIPTNGYTNNGTAAPTNAIEFESNPINWTQITSLTNADLAPTAFSDQTITVDELSTVNIAVTPSDAGWNTTITDNDSSGLTLVGHNVEGTAPEVLNDNVANPSDTYTITVTRTNSYGSSTGTLTIIVTNLTAPVTAISGWNHVSGTTAMVDSNTMGDGSVVHFNTSVADGERFVIEQAYIETNILPNLNGTGDKYVIGLSNQPETFSTVELSDWDAAIVWEYETSSSHTFKFYRDGSVVQNIVISSLTDAYYDYAIEINGTSAWLIACNVNSIMNEPSPANGGSFSHTYEATNIEDSAPSTIVVAAIGTTADIANTDVEIVDTPAAPTSVTTPFSKAIDFSGGSEHLSTVWPHGALTPLSMNGTARTIAAHSTDSTKTTDAQYAMPWATAIVFKYDGNNSNQHIWNCGEGAGSTDDNIYLRVEGTGTFYFGWGRQGETNECRLGTWGVTDNVNHWHAFYIAHKGTRLSAADATPANLADAFDIRFMSTNDTTAWGGIYQLSTVANWTNGTTGARMDRSVASNPTIGGRGTNRSFNGKVASFVVTTLMADTNMPTDTEIEAMITNPIGWVTDYKENQFYRLYNGQTSGSFTLGALNEAISTQVYLMGDGSSDSYANGIRNYIRPDDTTYTKLAFNSMVSNDIETVNINGLT
jgi:hypothetical protein